MVKKTTYLIIAISIISSCTLLDKFSIKECDNEKNYSIVDTASFYELTEKYRIAEGSNIKIDIEDMSLKHNGLKFYKEGKVAFLIEVNLNKPNSLNPEKASKGVYCFNEKGNFMEFIYKSVQSGYFLSKKQVEFEGEIIVEYTKESSKGGGFYSRYIKREIPKEALVYTPNW